MPQNNHNKDVPANEYRYSVVIDTDDIIKIVRSDEELVIGPQDDLVEFFGGRKVSGPLGCEIDIVEMAEEATLPRTFGDEIRNTPIEETDGLGHPERLRNFAAMMKVYVEYGFERREGNNPL